MHRNGTLQCGLGLLCVLGCSAAAQAQTAGQLWANAIVDRFATERLTYEVDLEPKTQPFTHAGQPTWVAIQTTPHVEYALATWIDILGEVNVGFKDRSTEISTTTVTPRVGVRLHILSRIFQQQPAHNDAEHEKPPKRRLDIGTLLRLEDVHAWSSNEPPTRSSWRLRDRFAVAYPLNRPKTTFDGAVYLAADAEGEVPVGNETKAGAVDRFRVRTGIGYRQSFAWRFEALYIWTGHRNDQSGAMAVESHAIDLRVKRVF